MRKLDRVANTPRSWKTAGGWIAFLDEKGVLFLLAPQENARPERIDDNVIAYELTPTTLVFQTADGALTSTKL
jgi:hypothetical protein